MFFCLLPAIGFSSFADVGTADIENLENIEMDSIEDEESARLNLRRRAETLSCVRQNDSEDYCPWSSNKCTHYVGCSTGTIKDVSWDITSGRAEYVSDTGDLGCTISEQSASCSFSARIGTTAKMTVRYSCCTESSPQVPTRAPTRAPTSSSLFQTAVSAPMGYYIFNTESGRILDVNANMDCVDGTNVQLWDFLGNPNQRFHIDAGRIVSDMCNKALEPDSGVCSNHRNIQISTKSSGISQQWNVNKVSETKVTNVACDDMGLDILDFGRDNGSNIQLYQFLDGWNQKWIFKPARFHLVNPQTGKVLDVDANQNCADGSTIQIWDKSGSALNQVFHFEAVYWDGRYVGDMIVSDACNKAIDVTLANCSGGARVQLYSKNQGPSQVFKLQGEAVSHVVCDQVLDIKDGTGNGSTVQIYSNLQGWNQKWEVQYTW